MSAKHYAVTSFGAAFFLVVGVKPEEFADRLLLGEDADVFDGIKTVCFPLKVSSSSFVSSDFMDVNDGWFLFRDVAEGFVPVVKTVQGFCNCFFSEKISGKHWIMVIIA